MGGDTASSVVSSSEEESMLEQEYPQLSLRLPTPIGPKDGNGGTLGGEERVDFGVCEDVGRCVSSSCFDERRKRGAYRDVLENYNELQRRSEDLDAAKSKILSYYPGAWMEVAGGMKLSDYDVPKTTSLLVIGPKGSGKSSLVNRISRVFEDDKFAPDRAQVSYNASVGDGTYFLQEYMIPRDSTSFCLYDTRSLSDESSTNREMLTHWMTTGVRHGELVIRETDSSSLKTRLKCKARQSGYGSHEIRMVNFVIFVVNGVSILKSMYTDDEAEKQYSQMVATTFSCPFLSFKDDKPVIVVTHGDLLSLSDRARVRVHLGELLGISPTKQIFDIPESCDKATELAIVDMFRYSLEHADRNLPVKEWVPRKVCSFWQDLPSVVFRKSLPVCLCLLIVLWIAIIATHMHHRAPIHRVRPPPSSIHIDWHSIRHLWLG
ncbi:uncharacterized protein LOC131319918 isoform X2 [Rhododendron vialii]|uniref:uncharacterized protein LOC131319918 isoform X2 n=1 Tax=Rhododendron vialii TaxID=182163 RepID=UPI00265E2228|nr:uncharacterized protein LOC131319918 isoform X2 [Rhododendron vialii]